MNNPDFDRRYPVLSDQELERRTLEALVAAMCFAGFGLVVLVAVALQ